MTYYDDIADGYDELHKEEQMAKLELVRKELQLFPDDQLLDVGCGTGFSLDFFDVGSSTGIDPAKKLVEQYSGKQNILVGSAENLPFEDNSFDVVISMTAIQNFDDVRKGLEEIKRVGKDRFALTYLKFTQKDIDSLIQEIFSKATLKRIEQELDIIWIIQ